MDLQNVFYIIGIVFMSLMFILFVVVVISLLIIRAKVNAIHRYIEDRFSAVVSLFESGGKIIENVKGTGKKRSKK